MSIMCCWHWRGFVVHRDNHNAYIIRSSTKQIRRTMSSFHHPSTYDLTYDSLPGISPAPIHHKSRPVPPEPPSSTQDTPPSDDEKRPPCCESRWFSSRILTGHHNKSIFLIFLDTSFSGWLAAVQADKNPNSHNLSLVWQWVKLELNSNITFPNGLVYLLGVSLT